MNSLPQTLYRRVNSEEAMANHLEGILWFRSPCYFRYIKGPQNDPMEGIGSYNLQGCTIDDITDNKPIQSVFFLSFSETIQATEKFRKEQSYILKLKDPARLREIIKTSLPPEVMVEWGKVTYGKDMNVKYDLSLPDGIQRKYFHKPKEFVNEKEWRLVINFGRTDWIIVNKTFKCRFSALTDQVLWDVCLDNAS